MIVYEYNPIKQTVDEIFKFSDQSIINYDDILIDYERNNNMLYFIAGKDGLIDAPIYNNTQIYSYNVSNNNFTKLYYGTSKEHPLGMAVNEEKLIFSTINGTSIDDTAFLYEFSLATSSVVNKIITDGIVYPQILYNDDTFIAEMDFQNIYTYLHETGDKLAKLAYTSNGIDTRWTLDFSSFIISQI